MFLACNNFLLCQIEHTFIIPYQCWWNDWKKLLSLTSRISIKSTFSILFTKNVFCTYMSILMVKRKDCTSSRLCIRYIVGCKCRKLGKMRRKQSFLCSKAFFRNVNLFCMARPRLSWQNKVWYPSKERKRRPWQQQNFSRWLKENLVVFLPIPNFSSSLHIQP